VVLLINRKKI